MLKSEVNGMRLGLDVARVATLRFQVAIRRPLASPLIHRGFSCLVREVDNVLTPGRPKRWATSL
jgi:hypothetical protein